MDLLSRHLKTHHCPVRKKKKGHGTENSSERMGVSGMPRICNIINNMRELNMIDIMFDNVRSVQARKLKLSNPFLVVGEMAVRAQR